MAFWPHPDPEYEGAGATGFCLARVAPGCRPLCLLELLAQLDAPSTPCRRSFFGGVFGSGFSGGVACLSCLSLCLALLDIAKNPRNGCDLDV